jgi:hypothetical protein
MCGSSILSFTDLMNQLQTFILAHGSLSCSECTCVFHVGEGLVNLLKFLLRIPKHQVTGFVLPVIFFANAPILHRYCQFFSVCVWCQIMNGSPCKDINSKKLLSKSPMTCTSQITLDITVIHENAFFIVYLCTNLKTACH